MTLNALPESTTSRMRLPPWAAAVILLVLSFICYGSALQGPFIWDDNL